MSHTTELDNGVIIIYDSGDLGGPVHLRHPGMPPIETTWEEIWAIGWVEYNWPISANKTEYGQIYKKVKGGALFERVFIDPEGITGVPHGFWFKCIDSSKVSDQDENEPFLSSTNPLDCGE